MIGLVSVAAAGEQVGEQRLEDAEALRRDRARRAARSASRPPARLSAATSGGSAVVALADELERARDLAAQLGRLERHGAPVLAQDPRGERPRFEYVGDEDAVLDPAVRAVERARPTRPCRRATSIRASPAISPICQGGPSRYSSASKSAGSRKSRSRRVARRMSPRMRETRNVLTLVVVEVEADDVPAGRGRGAARRG